MNQQTRILLESNKMILKIHSRNSPPQERIEINELIMRIDCELKNRR